MLLSHLRLAEAFSILPEIQKTITSPTPLWVSSLVRLSSAALGRWDSSCASRRKTS